MRERRVCIITERIDDAGRKSRCKIHHPSHVSQEYSSHSLQSNRYKIKQRYSFGRNVQLFVCSRRSQVSLGDSPRKRTTLSRMERRARGGGTFRGRRASNKWRNTFVSRTVPIYCSKYKHYVYIQLFGRYIIGSTSRDSIGEKRSREMDEVNDARPSLRWLIESINRVAGRASSRKSGLT